MEDYYGLLLPFDLQMVLLLYYPRIPGSQVHCQIQWSEQIMLNWRRGLWLAYAYFIK
jgi:hypothetical protein